MNLEAIAKVVSDAIKPMQRRLADLETKSARSGDEERSQVFLLAKSAGEHGAKIESIQERIQELDIADVRKAPAGIDALSKALAEVGLALTETESTCELRIKSVEDAVGALEQKHQADLAALRNDLNAATEVEELKSLLSEERIKRASEVTEARADLEHRLKAMAEAASEREQSYKTELAALRKELNVSAEIKALRDLVAEQRAEAMAACGKVDTDLRELRSEVRTLNKALSESVDEHKAALAKVAKNLSEIPEVPALPTELASVPDTLRALTDKVASVETKLARADDDLESVRMTVKGMDTFPRVEVEQWWARLQEKTSADNAGIVEKISTMEKQIESAIKLASGCMRFAGGWEESGEYGIGETVAHKNAMWIAMRDKPGNPGERDSGWKMGMKSSTRLITPYEHR